MGTVFRIALMKVDGVKIKSCQKSWVLAPTLSKTMGAKAPTAPMVLEMYKLDLSVVPFLFS